MGPELEIKANSDGIKALGVKENAGNGGLSGDSKDEYLKCKSNCEEYALSMDKSTVQPLLTDGNKNVEVDFEEFTTTGRNGMVETECQDTTESSSSSSFGDTDSDAEDSTDTSNAEVGLDSFGDNSPILDINGFGELLRMRKKRVTPHWRAFVGPEGWRLKWSELKIRMFKAQAQKCDGEVEIDRKNFPVEDFGLNDGRKDKVMKRKKRRRIEDKLDLKSYMSNHNLFSYYENKIHNAYGTSLDEEWHRRDKIHGSDESEVNGERLWLESGGDNNSSEGFLRQIALLQTQISQLKSRLDKITTENAGMSCWGNDLGLVEPSNLISSARSPASPVKNGDRMVIGYSNKLSHLTSLNSMGNVVMPKGAVCSLGGTTHFPDVIEGTGQSLEGDALKIDDEVLIYDERLKEGTKNYDLGIQPIEQQQVAKEEPESTFTEALTERELQRDLQSPGKMRSISNLTASKKGRGRKRRRKAGPGRPRFKPLG